MSQILDTTIGAGSVVTDKNGQKVLVVAIFIELTEAFGTRVFVECLWPGAPACQTTTVEAFLEAIKP